MQWRGYNGNFDQVNESPRSCLQHWNRCPFLHWDAKVMGQSFLANGPSDAIPEAEAPYQMMWPGADRCQGWSKGLSRGMGRPKFVK